MQSGPYLNKSPRYCTKSPWTMENRWPIGSRVSPLTAPSGEARRGHVQTDMAIESIAGKGRNKRGADRTKAGVVSTAKVPVPRPHNEGKAPDLIAELRQDRSHLVKQGGPNVFRLGSDSVVCYLLEADRFGQGSPISD